MRFPYNTGWSPWLTVGFWKANIWSSYGTTSYGGGFIDYDYVKLSSYVNGWQFKIIMTRTSKDSASPTIHKLSFTVSDSRTTAAVDINQLLNDKPAAIFVPTDFVYQYGVDPEIGGSICSPSSVAMILRSYKIPVNVLQFARDTRDPYFGIFGIWPRVVQNASQYGLDGSVTRYRTWSQAREVLAKGGRIAMSVSQPLYSGHLMMLAGFTANGDPIVHDPARSQGYSYVFGKSDLSHSWFDKGGVSYTFFLADSQFVTGQQPDREKILANGFFLNQNYPNPFNPTTTISYQLPKTAQVKLVVCDVLGREISTLATGEIREGYYAVQFDASQLPSGMYICRLAAGEYSKTIKMILSR